VRGEELGKHPPLEQLGEHGHGEQEAGLARQPSLAIQGRARDILPKNIRLKLLFTIHITLVPENASSRSDELSTEVSFIL
jgi:hypothetical protein